MYFLFLSCFLSSKMGTDKATIATTSQYLKKASQIPLKTITSLDIVDKDNGLELRNPHVTAELLCLILEQNHKLGHLEQMNSQKFQIYLGGNFMCFFLFQIFIFKGCGRKTMPVTDCQSIGVVSTNFFESETSLSLLKQNLKHQYNR